MFTHCLGGAAQGGLLFPRLSKPQRDRRIQKWTRTLLKQVGVELKVGAHAPAGPILLVSNHISWVDILALHAVCPCRFVANADVAGIPAWFRPRSPPTRQCQPVALQIVVSRAAQSGPVLTWLALWIPYRMLLTVSA
jgi:hypothetical protein